MISFVNIPAAQNQCNLHQSKDTKRNSTRFKQKYTNGLRKSRQTFCHTNQLKSLILVLGILPSGKFPPERSTSVYSLTKLFRFAACFARVRIEDSSRNRFALNCIQRDFFRGDFFLGGFFPGGFYPDTNRHTYFTPLVHKLRRKYSTHRKIFSKYY